MAGKFSSNQSSGEEAGFFGKTYNFLSSGTLNLPTILDKTDELVQGTADTVRESALDLGRQAYLTQEAL